MPKIFGKNTKFEKRELSLPHLFADYFLMSKKLLLSLAVLLLASAASLSAQEQVRWRVGHLSADSLTLHIDTLSINPQTFHIQDVNKEKYRLDPLTATLYIQIPVCWDNDSFSSTRSIRRTFRSRWRTNRWEASNRTERNTKSSNIPFRHSARC